MRRAERAGGCPAGRKWERPGDSLCLLPALLWAGPFQMDLASIYRKWYLWGGFEILIILLQDLKEAVGTMIILMKDHRHQTGRDFRMLP